MNQDKESIFHEGNPKQTDMSGYLTHYKRWEIDSSEQSARQGSFKPDFHCLQLLRAEKGCRWHEDSGRLRCQKAHRTTLLWIDLDPSWHVFPIASAPFCEGFPQPQTLSLAVLAFTAG